MVVLNGLAAAPAKRTERKWSSAIWIGLLTLSMAGLLAYSESDKGPLRSRAYRLRHIDSDAAQAHLERLNIGTDYNTLSSDVIIVTSDRTLDLTKATSVITLADRERPVEIRPLLVPTEQLPAPSKEELAVRLRRLTFGSLLNAPPTNAPNPAIVDLFEGTLIGIASAEVLDQIEADIEAWKQEKSPAPAAVPTDEASPSLADIAGQLFVNDTEQQAPVAEPNAIEPAAEEADEPVTETPDDAVEEAIDAAEPDTEPEATEDTPTEAMEDLREQIDRIPTDPTDQGSQELRAALEMLLGSAQETEQDTAAQDPTDPTGTDPDEALTAAEAQDEVPPETDTLSGIVTQAVLPVDKADEQFELSITLPEEVEVEALIELVGKQLGLNYMYDPAILRNQKVMLKVHDGEIRMRDLYSLLESVLRFRGFVMTRRDRLVTIARQDQATTLDPVLRLPDEPIQPGDVVVSSVFGLQHIAADVAQRMLTQMKLGTDFVPIPETGTLIVTDYAFRMERIRDVIAMIDVAGTPKDFQFRQIRYMEATELAPKVKALASEIQGVTITVAGQQQPSAAAQATALQAATPAERARLIAQQRAQQQAQARAQQQAQSTADQTAVYLEADERTNRVLMIGYASELDVVNQLIDSLDVPSFDLRYVKEYVIQYVEATEVVTVLNELGVARVTVAARQQQAARQPVVRPGQQLTPQQQAQQQAQLQQQQAARGGAAGTNEPYISLRAATNSLLVNATEEQHKAIELTISHVDVMQRDQRTIREYEIQYVDTQSILETLTDLGIISPQAPAAGSATAAGRTAAAARAGQQQQQQQQQAAMAGEGVAPMALPMADGTEREITAAEPQIAVLAATNSLLIHATPRQHAAIAMVIAHADRQRDRMFAPYVVYALENQDPDELAGILNTLIQETVDEAAAGARTEPDARIQTRQPQVATLPSGEEQRIRIVPDPKTYSLIVYANQRNQQWVGELIRELDEYRPQVLLDVTLVEIKKDDAFQFDLDLIAKTYGGTSLLSGTSLVGSRADFSPNNFLDARSPSGMSGESTAKAFFNSEKVQALLDTVERKGYGRVMAKPKILVNDNQEGEIRTENITSIAQKRSQTIPGQAGTDNIVTEDVSFSEYTSGITLAIKPHISKGEMLRLEITLERKDFDFTRGDTVRIGGDDVPRPPDLISTDVTTVATVPDGSTIILGGLERVSQNKRHGKVPILGDLPLVGGLFRSINNSDDQSRLYVFVKANILRPGDQAEGMEDMRRVSEHNRRQFEELEERFQKMQTWPGIKDRPMDPIRVLEED